MTPLLDEVMEKKKKNTMLPVIFTLTLTSIVLVIGNAHLCHLQSMIVEIALFSAILIGACVWTARAKANMKAWLRTGISLLIAFALQHAYLAWLHSDTFPQALLSQQARERQAEIDNPVHEMIKTRSTDSGNRTSAMKCP